jgi:hypothetical protein
MLVVEQFAEGIWGRAELCGDVVCVTRDFVALFDTAEAAPESSLYGVASGREVGEVAAQELERLPAGATIHEAISRMTERVARFLGFGTGGVVQGLGGPRTCMVAFSRERREMWRVGDSHFAIDGDVNLGKKLVDELAYGLRAAYVEALLASGAKPEMVREVDLGFAFLKPFFDIQAVFANAIGRFGYGVIDGAPIPPGFAEVLRVPRDTAEVIMATDGYASVGLSLVESERELAREISEDPLGVKEPFRPRCAPVGGTGFDDRAYVRVQFPATDTLDLSLTHDAASARRPGAAPKPGDPGTVPASRDRRDGR